MLMVNRSLSFVPEVEESLVGEGLESSVEPTFRPEQLQSVKPRNDWEAIREVFKV